MKLDELRKKGKELNIKGAGSLKKKDLEYAITQMEGTGIYLGNLPVAKLRRFAKHMGVENTKSMNKKQLMDIFKEMSVGDGFFDDVRGFFGNVGEKVKKGTESIAKTITEPVKDFFDYRKGFNKTTKRTMEKYGSQHIVAMTLQKCPIAQVNRQVMNVLSFGAFEKTLKKYGFDELFHLSLLVSLQNGKKVVVEKNEEINIDTKLPEFKSKCEQKEIKFRPVAGFTLNKLIQTTKAKIPEKQFFDYDSLRYNCQLFLLDVLKSNGLLKPEYKRFIYQDVRNLFNDLKKDYGYLEKIGKVATRSASIWNKITGKGDMILIPENDKVEFWNMIKGSAFTGGMPTHVVDYETSKKQREQKFEKDFDFEEISNIIAKQTIKTLTKPSNDFRTTKLGEFHNHIMDVIKSVSQKIDTKTKMDFITNLEKSDLYKGLLYHVYDKVYYPALQIYERQALPEESPKQRKERELNERRRKVKEQARLDKRKQDLEYYSSIDTGDAPAYAEPAPESEKRVSFAPQKVRKGDGKTPKNIVLSVLKNRRY